MDTIPSPWPKPMRVGGGEEASHHLFRFNISDAEINCIFIAGWSPQTVEDNDVKLQNYSNCFRQSLLRQPDEQRKYLPRFAYTTGGRREDCLMTNVLCLCNRYIL